MDKIPWAQLTPWFILVPTLIMGAYAALVAAYGKTGDTISEHVTRWSKLAPMLPFALGVLIGHWLWHG